MTDDQITDLLIVADGPEPADLALVFGSAEPAVVIRARVGTTRA